MPSVEPPQGVVVRMLPPGQPQVRYLVPAGRLQLPARAYPGHETVQPHAQQRTWMVGWRSQHLPVYLHLKLPPVLPVQSVNELGHEPRRMVQRQQFVKRRRQHPHLLSAHRSKRHITISPTGVASKVHPTTYPLPAQTSETGSEGIVPPFVKQQKELKARFVKSALDENLVFPQGK